MCQMWYRRNKGGFMMIEQIDEILCWLKVAENFDNEEVEKLKELINCIFDTLFEINGTEHIS